jgi:thymidylate synthase
MKQYLELMRHIYTAGRDKKDRTGTGTRSVFGAQMRFDLSAQQFPLLTTKQVFLRGLAEELFWFGRGSTDNNELVAKGVHIWDNWALQEDVVRKKNIYDLAHDYAEKFFDGNYAQAVELLEATDAESGIIRNGPHDYQPGGAVALCEKAGIPLEYTRYAAGELGPIYGSQWRCFEGIDQIAELLTQLKEKPFSRRHVVTAWNPKDLPDESVSPQQNVANGKMALAPCHCLFQFIVEEMTHEERVVEWRLYKDEDFMPTVQELDEAGIPTLRLSCQLYQRKPHCAF